MRRELRMPKLGLTMTEGILVEWMVKPDDTFKIDQVLFVVESEKTANDIPAQADGTLTEIVAETGETLPCGAVLGYWEDGVADDATTSPATPEPTPAATHAPVAPVVPAPAPRAQTEHATSAASTDGERVPVTPLARRTAVARGIDLMQVTGSGPRGRIRVRDLPETASPLPTQTSDQTNDHDPALPAAGALRAPTATEQTIAHRLTVAKQQTPHFYLAVEAQVDALLELRKQVNATRHDHSLTLNDFVLAAVGRALAQMPQLNRVWTDAGIQTFARSDVGMAVDTERGLLVPVLRDVGAQTITETASVARAAIARARSGRLTADETAGGAITVSNAGMHGVTYMASIINPGQAMILGVGAVREVFRPNRKGKPRLRREMGLVLSADHRVLDGVSALRLLKRITGLLETPLTLLVA